MAKKPNWVAATAFYILFVIGITVFVVYPGWHGEYAILTDIWKAGLFGLVAYSTYDLTNLATLDKWPVVVTVVDLIWGTSLTAATSTISIIILKAIIK